MLMKVKIKIDKNPFKIHMNNANEKLQKAKETLSEYYNISEKVGSTKNEWQDVAEK